LYKPVQMKVLKALNRYLIENHPLVWHSKAIQLTLTGILFWVLSFVAGYALTGIYTLQKYSFTDQYWQSGFVFYHLIFCLIALSFWAISFYRNNAWKNNYPMQKGYFTLLFFLLFVPISLIISPYFPFTYGSKLKIKKLIATVNVQKDIDLLNRGFPFMACSVNDYQENTNSEYSITNRVYPDPYPLNFITTYEDNKWTSTELKIKGSNGLINYSAENNAKENAIAIRDRYYQVYKSKQIYPNGDSCNPAELITKFYHKDELDSPAYNSVLNFSTLFIPADISNEYDLYRKESKSDRYKKNIAPLIYKWIRHNDTNAIKNCITDFASVCNRYSVRNNINADLLLDYLKGKSYKNLFKTVVYQREPDFTSELNDQVPVEELIALKDRKKIADLLESKHMLFFQEKELRQLIVNFGESRHSFLKLETIEIALNCALFLVALFICFEFTTRKSFLISIPVAGIIAIVDGLLYSFTNRFINCLFTTFLVISSLTLVALYSKKLKKSILAVLINLTYFCSPFIVLFLILEYNEQVKLYSFFDKCKGCMEYGIKDSVLASPLFFILYALAGLLLFLQLLKKWNTYKE